MNTDSAYFSANTEQIFVFRLFIKVIFLLAPLCLLSFEAISQRVAVVAPEPNRGNSYAEHIAESLKNIGVKVIDGTAASAAFRSGDLATPFNLSVEEAKLAGAAIGCDFLLLIRSDTQRRSSFEKSAYYESTAAIFMVSSRTGRLVNWQMIARQADTPKEAFSTLNSTAPSDAATLKATIVDELKKDLGHNRSTPEANPIEVLENDSPNDKSFRPPIPYKRIRPAYTPMAYLFSVEATVDAEVDIDVSGNIMRLEIVRWAGYGLDESVAAAIRAMNWRPAERKGKTLPMRVLLRYNFKKVEKDDDDSP